MYKKKPCLILSLYFVFQWVYCQDAEKINRSLQDFASQMRFGSSRTGASILHVDGSEFLDENFVNGEILTQQSQHFADIPMRYNAYRDDIEVKLPDSMVYTLSDPSKIFQIMLKNNILVYTDFNSGGKINNGYLFLLYSGKNNLYARNIKIFKERIPSNGILPETPAKLIDKPREYYIKVDDARPLLFNSKNELIQMLSKHSSEIENYIKKQKLKLNNDADLIKVLTYYDSL